MLDPRTVASTYVRALLAAVEAEGIAADTVLQGLVIDQVQLAAANGRLGVMAVHRIWQRALVLADDSLLGLKVADNVKPGTFRVLGLAAMSSATLAEAVQLMLRYHRLVSEAGVLSAIHHDNGDISLCYTEQPMPFQMLAQQVEAIVGAILRQADSDLCRVHCQLADQQLADLPSAGLVTAFAIQWLSTQSSGAMRIDDLARALGLSVRSLQRQLQAEGRNWTAVVDSARQQGFVSLRQQGLSLETIAQKLGYHDASSLSRAARRWFGKPPMKHGHET